MKRLPISPNLCFLESRTNDDDRELRFDSPLRKQQRHQFRILGEGESPRGPSRKTSLLLAIDRTKGSCSYFPVMQTYSSDEEDLSSIGGGGSRTQRSAGLFISGRRPLPETLSFARTFPGTSHDARQVTAARLGLSTRRVRIHHDTALCPDAEIRGVISRDILIRSIEDTDFHVSDDVDFDTIENGVIGCRSSVTHLRDTPGNSRPMVGTAATLPTLPTVVTDLPSSPPLPPGEGRGEINDVGGWGRPITTIFTIARPCGRWVWNNWRILRMVICVGLYFLLMAA